MLFHQDRVPPHFHSAVWGFFGLKVSGGNWLAQTAYHLATLFPWLHTIRLLLQIRKGHCLCSTTAHHFVRIYGVDTSWCGYIYTCHAYKCVDWAWTKIWYVLVYPHWVLNIYIMLWHFAATNSFMYEALCHLSLFFPNLNYPCILPVATQETRYIWNHWLSKLFLNLCLRFGILNYGLA